MHYRVKLSLTFLGDASAQAALFLGGAGALSGTFSSWPSAP